MLDEDLKGRILWCSKQKKGLKLKIPNDNLCDAYLKKANNSLKAMNVNAKENLNDWAADAAYYARYHAIYALLQKCGIECEIHDCSLAAIRLLFKEELTEQLLQELEKAKKQRIDLVYYTNRIVPEEEIKRNVASAPNFVISTEKIVSKLNNIDRINELRSKLKKAMA